MTETTPSESKSPGVPPETATEEWRLLSADVAYTLWKAERRVSHLVDPKADAEAWAAAAADFRVLVRYVLRALEKEGIKLRHLGPDNSLPVKSDAWRTQTARAAWLFWLNARRRVFPPTEYLEAEAWQHVAADQRILVRKVFEELGAKGIRFAP